MITTYYKDIQNNRQEKHTSWFIKLFRKMIFFSNFIYKKYSNSILFSRECFFLKQLFLQCYSQKKYFDLILFVRKWLLFTLLIRKKMITCLLKKILALKYKNYFKKIFMLFLLLLKKTWILLLKKRVSTLFKEWL